MGVIQPVLQCLSLSFPMHFITRVLRQLKLKGQYSDELNLLLCGNMKLWPTHNLRPTTKNSKHILQQLLSCVTFDWSVSCLEGLIKT